MNHQKIVLVAAVLLCLVSAGLAIWSNWPAAIQHQVIFLTAQDLQPGINGGSPSRKPTVAQLTLEWPATLPVGETQSIHIRIEPVGTQPASNPPITAHLVAETQLDLAGILPQPEGMIQQPWQIERPLTFYWTVKPDSPGLYTGDVWFYIVFVQSDGTIASKKPISDQSIEFRAIDFWGMPYQTIRLASLICLGIGISVFFVTAQVYGRKPLSSHC